MADSARRRAGGPIARLSERPLALVIAYYLILGAVVAVLSVVAPGLEGLFSTERFNEMNQGSPGNPFSSSGGPPLTAAELAGSALLAMTGAYLLMLPVAWVYIFTRQKKGYAQSVVQTLIILPLVVSGVVILVKNSVALAFSLGGIVAAVSFRNTLRDTKDAVYIFLATSVGLAAGVQVLSVAAAISIFFNLIIVLLWYTDFGRVPAHLEGAVAERRLAKARRDAEILANRTGAFVSVLDQQVLQSMAPEQLDKLAERAWRRRQDLVQDTKPRGDRFDGNVRVTVPAAEAGAARRIVEELLDARAKDWRFVAGTSLANGAEMVLEFRVRFKKSVPRPQLLEELRGATTEQTAVDFVA